MPTVKHRRRLVCFVVNCERPVLLLPASKRNRSPSLSDGRAMYFNFQGKGQSGRPAHLSKKKPSPGSPDTRNANLEFVKKLLADEDTRTSIASQCEILKSTISEWPYFKIELGGPPHPGIAGFEFYPLWLREWAERKAGEIHSELFRDLFPGVVVPEQRAEAEAYLKSEQGQKLALRFFAEHRDATARRLAARFAFGLAGKLSHLLTELELEVCCIIRGWLYNANGLDSNGGVDQLVREITNERRRFLKKSIATAGRPRWENLKTHYDRLLSEATAAKRLYEGNQARDWRAMVKAGYPDFDTDLISFLSVKPDDIERRMREFPFTKEAKEDYSLPANMALEQAARLCGMRRFRIGPRRIRELMNQAPAVANTQDIREAVKSANSEISLKQPERVKPKARRVSSKTIVSRKVH